jgi:transposase
MELDKETIRERMQEWRNLKVLYQKAINQKEKRRNEIQKLRIKNKDLKIENAELRTRVENLELQLEELKEIIFGKSKDKNDENHDPSFIQKKERKKAQRNKESYQRKTPDPDEITKTEKHTITHCLDCNTKLRNKRIVIFYEEDIPLPDENTQLKEVIEYQIEKGWCFKCRKWHSAIHLPPKKAVLGDKVRFYICYLSILIRASYSQIIHLLWDTYRFAVSRGEIENIMEEMGRKLRKEFERIKKRLQKSKGVHLDETSWRKLYLWVMAGMGTEDVIYLAGKSRGHGNVDELLGKEFSGVKLSDAYAAYKNKPGEHQQCWVHPNRKLRDLANAKVLPEKKRKHCEKTYQEFSVIYAKLRKYISEPFDVAKRKKSSTALNALIAQRK